MIESKTKLGDISKTTDVNMDTHCKPCGMSSDLKSKMYVTPNAFIDVEDEYSKLTNEKGQYCGFKSMFLWKRKK